MAMTLADLVSSPDNYLHSFEGDAAVFVPMNRNAYRRSIFLDARISPAADGAMQVPVTMLADASLPDQPMGWIFHVAHCGSTLLARALEELAGGLVLKEPAALRQLGFAPESAKLDVVLGLLARRYDPGVMTVAKANVPVNFILQEIAERRRDDAAIVLYWNLDDYLVAILRSENHRQWLRGLTGSFSERLGLEPGATDAERAAALWLGQMDAFLGLFAAMPSARSLEAGRLFAEPGTVIAAAGQFFGYPPEEAAAEAVAKGPLFATYSKRPDLAFGNAERLARADEVSLAIVGELAQARTWLAARGCEVGAIEQQMSARALG